MSRKLNPVQWTGELRNALASSRVRLKTNKQIARTLGLNENLICRYLRKNVGWVEEKTFRKLCQLEEFRDLKYIASNPLKLKGDEQLLLDVFRELPENIQKELLLELSKFSRYSKDKSSSVTDLCHFLKPENPQ
ncbi:MAG: hypothetical protein WAX69_17070 [Victivallales bacterium]